MTRYIYAAAMAVLGIGIAFVYAGVIMRGAYQPGAILVAVGLLLAALGAVMELLPGRAADGERVG